MCLSAARFWPRVSDRKNAQFAITEASCVTAAMFFVSRDGPPDNRRVPINV